MKNICLLAVTGSRAYGLDHADSDTDRMGIFIAPTLEIAGLDWNQHKETWSNASPEGDDTSYHEIGKYFRLVLKGNPTLIELLYMNEYEILEETGYHILSLRDSIISETNVRPSYYGYAAAQLREFQNRPNPKDKMPRHCLRIARQAVELLTTGDTNVRVEDPQEYFDLTKLSKVDIIEKLGPEVEKIKTCPTILPATVNRPRIAEFLRKVRRQYV